MNINLFNPSIASGNTGDQIIIDSVKRELQSIFKEGFIFDLPTQEIIGRLSVKYSKDSKYSYLGGTNILSSNMLRYKQWNINFTDSFLLKNIILLGVGWWQYQDNPDFYTKFILKNVLEKKFNHSVRDGYTEDKLNSIGMFNVLNTGCPTMWRLTDYHCKEIPVSKGDDVVFTLTDYNKSEKYDISFINILLKYYRNIYFWPQGSGDLDYFRSLSVKNINVISPNLNAYDEVLSSNQSLDYVGTRLHGGVRALQKRRRSLILTIDNRAHEIALNTRLPVVARSNREQIENWIISSASTSIKMPWSNIELWKNQFLDS
jgi:hypothetical protein